VSPYFVEGNGNRLAAKFYAVRRVLSPKNSGPLWRAVGVFGCARSLFLKNVKIARLAVGLAERVLRTGGASHVWQHGG